MTAGGYFAIVLAACAIQPAFAQPATTRPLGTADMQSGGEWALGRWEGTISRVGTSSGNMGLAQESRTLIIEKDGTGATKCYWFVSNTSKYPTKSCKVTASGTSLVSAGRPLNSTVLAQSRCKERGGRQTQSALRRPG